MKRKFDIGDLVIINSKASPAKQRDWLEVNPMGIGEVIEIGRNYYPWWTLKMNSNSSKLVYRIKFIHDTYYFYSWELDLVSKKDE